MCVAQTKSQKQDLSNLCRNHFFRWQASYSPMYTPLRLFLSFLFLHLHDMIIIVGRVVLTKEQCFTMEGFNPDINEDKEIRREGRVEFENKRFVK